jgi:hypothetical protein
MTRFIPVSLSPPRFALDRLSVRRYCNFCNWLASRVPVWRVMSTQSNPECSQGAARRSSVRAPAVHHTVQ